MARTSYTAARTELFGVLAANITTGAPNAALTGVTKVFKYEVSPGTAVKPVSLTISAAKWDAFDFVFRIRIYATLEGSEEIGQANLDTAVDQVDTLLRAGGHWGPSEWTFGWDANIAVMVAWTDARCGREDVGSGLG